MEGGIGGGRYYSVGFFEEFIVGGGAGERVLVAVRVVSLEKLVQSWGYVGHWRCRGIAGMITMREWQRDRSMAAKVTRSHQNAKTCQGHA